jgi:hypothetical protein
MVADFRGWRAARREMVRAATLPRVLAVTDLLRRSSGSTAAAEGAVAGRSDGETQGDAVAIGRAVHGVLQSIDLRTGAELGLLVARHAAAQGVTGRDGDVADLVSAALASPIVREATGHRLWRELSVAALVEGIVLEGVVDLCFRTPRGLVVVDYKTEVLTAAVGAGAARPEHVVQTVAYAGLLAEATGEPVERCVVCRLRPHGASEVVVTEPVGRFDEVRRRVAALATGR